MPVEWLADGRTDWRVILTRHVDGVGQKVSQVRGKDDETTLSLGESPNIGEFEHQRYANADHDTNKQTSEEDAHKDTYGFKEATDAEVFGAVFVFLGCLKDDNGDGIVENRLAEDQSI